MHKIWIAGNGLDQNCLLLNVGWIESMLQSGGLEGDLESL